MSKKMETYAEFESEFITRMDAMLAVVAARGLKEDRAVQVISARIQAAAAYAVNCELQARGKISGETLIDATAKSIKALLSVLADNLPNERTVVVACVMRDVSQHAMKLIAGGSGDGVACGDDIELTTDGSGRA